MKSRVLAIVLVMALAAALIGGATSAWFTADAELEDVEFTAGTLKVDADGKKVAMQPKRFQDNINPGDCATVCWKIINTGSKKAELRVKLNSQWFAAEGKNIEDKDQVAFFAPKPGSGWVMYEVKDAENAEENGIWLYYTEGPIRGTYKDKDPKDVKLCLVVGFDGEAMDNDFQGASFEIAGEVEAVQATNGAPEAVWGEAFTTATSDGYSHDALIDYFINGEGKNMSCWTGKEQEEPGTPKIDSFKYKITGVGSTSSSDGTKYVTVSGWIQNAIYENGAPANGFIDFKIKILKGDGTVLTSRDFEGEFVEGKYTLDSLEIPYISQISSTKVVIEIDGKQGNPI